MCCIGITYFSKPLKSESKSHYANDSKQIFNGVIPAGAEAHS